MININNQYSFYNDPFPHMIFDNFLDENQAGKIVDEINEISKIYSVNKVMGGRFQYQINHFNNKSFSSELYNLFNSEKYFKKLNNLLLSKTKKNDEFFYSDNFKKIVKKKNFYQKILKKTLPFLLKESFFLHMDFSLAQEEYVREPHHDRDTRIINFLLYLNTLEENNGGAFEIYKHKKNNISNLSKTPNLDNLEIDKKIVPKSGKLIIFLSTPNSIHGVEKFKPLKNQKRYFIYGGYTSFFDVNWKKNK